MAKGKRIDWDKAKRLYSAGQLTNKEIAEAIGTTRPGSIRVRASKEGWTRDLSTQVAEKTRAKLAKSAEAEDDDSAVDAAAEAASAVVREHRAHIVTGRAIIDGMFAELMEVGKAPKEVKEALINGLAGKDVDVGLIVSAFSVGSRAKSMGQLATSLTKLIQAERVSFNLDEHKAEKPFEKALREIMEDEHDA